MLNLVLAGVWLGFALLAFAQPHLNPDGREWVIPTLGIPVSWVALAFFAYNLIRWGMSQRSRPTKPAPPPPPAETRIKAGDPQWDFSQPRPRDDTK